MLHEMLEELEKELNHTDCYNYDKAVAELESLLQRLKKKNLPRWDCAMSKAKESVQI